MPESVDDSDEPEVAFEACSYFVNDIELEEGMWTIIVDKLSNKTVIV